jgi:hypothetical protein
LAAVRSLKPDIVEVLSLLARAIRSDLH